jgi:hypothetical protein
MDRIVVVAKTDIVEDVPKMFNPFSALIVVV